MLRIVIFVKICGFRYPGYPIFDKLPMSTTDTLKPLKVGGTIISFPFINPNSEIQGVDELLVQIKTEYNQESVSIQYTGGQCHQQYAVFSNKNNKSSLHDHIVDYVDKYVEEPVTYVCYHVSICSVITAKQQHIIQ